MNVFAAWSRCPARAVAGVQDEIWEVGQRVANNTIHIPALYKTNAVVREILSTAVKIKEGAAVIETHARGCPGCPQCMLRH